mgnify:CR=1 FL=1
MEKRKIYRLGNTSSNVESASKARAPGVNRLTNEPDPGENQIEGHYDADEEVNSWTYGLPREAATRSVLIFRTSPWAPPTTPHVF